MKNTKVARILVLSFLVLTGYTLLCVKSNAQSQFSSPSLGGTKWKAKAGIVLSGGWLSRIEFDYDFIDES